MQQIFPTCLVLALIVSCATGCKTMNEVKLVPENVQSSVQNLLGKKEEPEFQEPVRMAAIWSDGVYDKIGVPAVRGFGARLFFYNHLGEPIKVDGELNVFGYDDAKPKQGFAANRKFVFERDKFQTHFSESELGPSYSVWVPWDKAGGDLKTISLIPIFKSGNGTIVKGGQSVNVLPGKTPSETETAENEGESNSAKRKPTVQTAGFSTEFDNEKIGMASYLESTGAKQMGLNSRDESTASNQRKSDVTTIVLPRTMTNRLNSLAPQAPFKRQRRQTTAPQTSNATLPQENDVQSKPERESSLSKPFSNSFEDRQGVFGLPGSHN